jgi:MoaA/NifB/PqqE/SkfB family radical SAM enzyme
MRPFEIGSLAVRHVRNAVAEEIYLRTGRDFTRPVAIHAMVNEICNYRCRYCEYWRMPNYRPEMSIADWRKALLDLADFIGPGYHVEFSGGEPYLKKGFLDLIQFCHDRGVRWGVTTNGSAFSSRKVVDATLAAKPMNVNISIDSHRPDVHDYSRGIEGSLDRIVSGIAQLRSSGRAAGLDFPIIVKPVVHRLNFRDMPKMVAWIQETGATAINFQPVDRWSPETYNELWIDDPRDRADMLAVRDELIALKRKGAPIMNSELILRAWDDHFLSKPAADEYRPCRVGMRNYFIRPDGAVEVCWYYKPIGNVRTSAAREIWHGAEARQRRQETVACDSLCLFTCLSQKTLTDKVKMGLVLISGNKQRQSPSEITQTPAGPLV